jgi:superfamily II DNA or RNA helicase
VKQAVGRITRTPGSKEVFDIVDKWSVLTGMFYKRNRVYFPVPTEKEAKEPCLFV